MLGLGVGCLVGALHAIGFFILVSDLLAAFEWLHAAGAFSVILCRECFHDVSLSARDQPGRG